MSKRNPFNAKRCSVDGCNAAHEANGYCALHYQRFKKHGDPLVTLSPGLGLSIAERLARSSVYDQASGCILWTGNTSNKGYGLIGVGSRKTVLTHRLAWELVNGEIPEGRCVCHRCDVPLCINPAHMFIGTQQDNMTDKMNKGRHVAPRGQEAPGAKLTEGQARRIFTDTRASAVIASEFGISDSAVRHIKKGSTWSHLQCA